MPAGRVPFDDGAVAIAVPSSRTDLKTLRLAQPVIETTSRVEVTAVVVLALAAAGVWLCVLPLELLRVVGT